MWLLNSVLRRLCQAEACDELKVTDQAQIDHMAANLILEKILAVAPPALLLALVHVHVFLCIRLMLTSI